MVLNNLQWMIFHKTKPNQTNSLDIQKGAFSFNSHQRHSFFFVCFFIIIIFLFWQDLTPLWGIYSAFTK